jgi:cell division septation protein DedD
MKSAARTFAIVIGVALLVACSRERQDWQSAQMADTVEAYDDFVAKHPDSASATQARERLQQLAEERDWQLAATTDTLAAYQMFATQYPGSRWTAEARIRIENFGLAPSSAASLPAAGDVAPEMTPAPDPAPATPTTAPASSPTSATSPGVERMAFGVQLGAFGSEAQARAEWQRLERSNASLLKSLSPMISTAQGRDGVLYRLRAETPDEAEARRLCAALSASGSPCIVVLPLTR